MISLIRRFLHALTAEPTPPTPAKPPAPAPCPACARADQAGLAPGELHPSCRKEQH